MPGFPSKHTPYFGICVRHRAELPASHCFRNGPARVDLAVSKPSAMALPAITSERISGDRVDTCIDNLVGCGFQDFLNF